MSYSSQGPGRDVSYQLMRLTQQLDTLNRKLNQALRDLERINQRLDSRVEEDRHEEPPRTNVASS